MSAPAPAARRDRLRGSLSAAGLSAALITEPHNVRYLSGVVSSNAALLVDSETGNGDRLATDSRYAGTVAQVAPDLHVVLDRDVLAGLATHIASLPPGARIGVELHHLTVHAHAALRQACGAAELVDLDRAVEAQRVAKDDDEIQLVTEACRITDQALSEMLDDIRIGTTEQEIARRLERRFVDLGADGPAFDSIVAAGENSAVPHHSPTDRPLQRGDLLIIDCGATFGGYCADTTRTSVVGVAADWQRELHALVLAAQRAGLDSCLEGTGAADVDAAARAVVAAAGHNEDFLHGLGHGVGLQIHEAPMLVPGGTGRLAARTPVTVEPGVYLPGRGGVRIEDTVLVRPSAHRPLHLTTTTTDLLVVG